MLIAFGWCLAGLVLLIAASTLIVRGGTHIARRLGISPVVIGATVVAIGTSTPELGVGIEAASMGNGELAIGNIAGAYVINILLILGLSALIRPLALRAETLWLDLPMMVAASFTLLAMAWDGNLSRTDGIVLVSAGLAYTAAVVYVARRESRAVQVSSARELAGVAGAPPPVGSTVQNLAALAIGIAVIVVGADWLVDGAVELARIWAVSDAFIGLTIVAIGTSSPELVTTIVSTIKGDRDIAIGNLLGSSVYNILFILGVTCIVPASGIPVDPALLSVELPVMVAVALACVPVFRSGRGVSRTEGAIFVGTYVAYLAYLIAVRT